MKKFLPKWMEPIAFGFLLSCFLSFFVSGLSTAIMGGINRDLPVHWVATWLPSWVIAFPLVLVVAPLVRRIVGTIVVEG